jgi:hypothetical protein
VRGPSVRGLPVRGATGRGPPSMHGSSGLWSSVSRDSASSWCSASPRCCAPWGPRPPGAPVPPRESRARRSVTARWVKSPGGAGPSGVPLTACSRSAVVVLSNSYRSRSCIRSARTPVGGWGPGGRRAGSAWSAQESVPIIEGCPGRIQPPTGQAWLTHPGRITVGSSTERFMSGPGRACRLLCRQAIDCDVRYMPKRPCLLTRPGQKNKAKYDKCHDAGCGVPEFRARR